MLFFSIVVRSFCCSEVWERPLKRILCKGRSQTSELWYIARCVLCCRGYPDKEDLAEKARAVRKKRNLLINTNWRQISAWEAVLDSAPSLWTSNKGTQISTSVVEDFLSCKTHCEDSRYERSLYRSSQGEIRVIFEILELTSSTNFFNSTPLNFPCGGSIVMIAQWVHSCLSQY